MHRRTEAHTAQRGVFLWPIFDACHLMQIQRLALAGGDHQVSDLACLMQEGPGLHHGELVVALEASHLEAHVGGMQGIVEIGQGQAVGGKPCRVGDDAHLAALAAGDGDLAGVAHHAELVHQFFCDAPQGKGGVGRLCREREQHDGHIVDLDGFHRPGTHDGRDDVLVGHELAPGLEQAILPVLPHKEAHRGDGPPRHRGGVDILHAVDLAQLLLERRGDELFDLAGAGAGGFHHHIHHRHHDLRLFFPGREPQGKKPQEEACAQKKR